MSTLSAPAAPDATKIAAAQGTANKDTAVAQAGLNSTNQVTPYGNLTYSQNGAWDDGTPRFTATQTLSPDQQQLFNTYTNSQQKLGDLGNTQIDRVSNLLSTPLDLNTATEGNLDNLARQRLDPMLQNRRSIAETRLANMGITPGSDAWKTQEGQIGRDENDAYNQLLLTGRQQGVSEALAQRNQPLNEITALMSGSQVQQPSFTNTPQTQVAPTDVMGANALQYQGQQNTYNQQMAQRNAMLGGLFGMAGTAAGGWARGGFSMPSFG